MNFREGKGEKIVEGFSELHPNIISWVSTQFRDMIISLLTMISLICSHWERSPPATCIYFVRHNSLKILENYCLLDENNCSDVVIVLANPIWDSKFSSHVFSFWCSLIPDENLYSTKYFKIVENLKILVYNNFEL